MCSSHIALLSVAFLLLAVVPRGAGQTERSEPDAHHSSDLQLALSMKAVGRLHEAESVLRAHLRTHSDDFAYLTELGLVLVAQGRRGEAISEYRKALREFPHKDAKSRAGLYCDLGLALEFSKRENEALDAYKKAIELQPTLVAAHIDLGNFYRFVKKDYKDAAAQLSEAVKVAPDDPVAHGGLAAIYADQSILDKAEEEFRLALKLSPHAVSLKAELAYVMERQMHHGQAESLFQEVIAEYPKFYRAHEGLARVLESMGQLHRAETQARKAVALRKDEGTLVVLADIMSKEGKTNRAKKFWLAVLQLNPSDAQALQHLGLLQKDEQAPPPPPPAPAQVDDEETPAAPEESTPVPPPLQGMGAHHGIPAARQMGKDHSGEEEVEDNSGWTMTDILVVVFVPILIVAVGGVAALCLVQNMTPSRTHPGNRYAASEHRSMKTPYDEMDNDTTGLLDSDW